MSATETALNETAVINVDVLFPTERADEPGSMHIRVLSPRNQMRLTALIEVNGGVSIRRNINAIVAVIQHELFDRIGVDARNENEAAVYFKTGDTHRDEFDSDYVRLIKRGYTDDFDPVESVEA